MKKLSAFFVVLLMCATMFAQTQNRPKVALVLSGGGAKGAAHIGVLEVLEEYDIPIDMVVGSSIGAIIGGLYAQGYTAAQIRELILSQDWEKLILDSNGQKDDYIFKVPFGGGKAGKPLTAFNRGIVAGRNVEALLERLVLSGHDSIDFNALPIPFACNALDLRSREEVVFHNGDLVQAIRASMSIPLMFEPVRKGDMVLMDGGMYNNLPVDIALKMGADIVIAVKLGEKDYEVHPTIETIMDVADQWFELYNRPKTEANIADADIFIGPGKGSYSTMSFSREAMVDLLKMGEDEAREHADEFRLLHKLLAEKEGKAAGARLTPAKAAVTVPELGGDPVVETGKASVLALGGYFDSEEIIALKLHVGFNERAARGSKVNAEVKLAYNLRADISYSYAFNRYVQVNGGWNYRNSSTNIFNQNYIPKNKFISNFFYADFAYRTRDESFKAKAGASYRIYTCEEGLNVFDAYVDLKYDTRDNIYFPTRGVNLRGRGDWFIGKYPAFIVHADGVIPVMESLWLTPSLDHRTVWTTKEVPFFMGNSLGGVQAERYMDFQIPFIGFNHIQYAANALTILSLDARYSFLKNHYVTASGGFTYDRPETFAFKDGRTSFGARLGYAYATRVGPLSVNVNWSSLTERVGVYLSFGYNF